MRRAYCLLPIGACLLALAGCAAGHGPNGEVIVGWDVATLPETAKEALGAAGQLLPPPWNFVATGLLGLAGTAAATYGAKKSGDAKAESARADGAVATHAAADAAWDESHARAVTAYAPAPINAVIPPVAVQGNTGDVVVAGPAVAGSVPPTI